MMKFKYIFIIYELISNVQCNLNKKEEINLNSGLQILFFGKKTCSDSEMCLSKWGYCGYGNDYCGEGCQSGPCYDNHENIINHKNFRCAFDTLDNKTRRERFDALKKSEWKPINKDEAAVFLAHVYHETDGLKTLIEYCAPGCGPNYVTSWCSIQGVPGKFYYGRGWFQLSYPCNYYAAGNALDLDLLNNPDLVSEKQEVAVKTAIWFFEANNMTTPAEEGDFASTTRIINGQQECDGGPEAQNQQTRVETYKRIRLCFGLGEPTINPTC